MPKVDEGASRRERILAAALDIAGREGLDALTTRRVAAEAGVNLGLLHYYFESKESLVAETLQLFMDELAATFRETGPAPDRRAPEDLLTELITHSLREAWKRPGLLFGLIGEIAGQVARSTQGGAEGLSHLEAAPPPAISTVVSAQRILVQRVGSILASQLGDDPGLVKRRSLQIFTSIFHPLLFTPFPRLVFGVEALSPAGREAYIRGVVADALTPPQSPARLR